jgi:hypothetical protein
MSQSRIFLTLTFAVTFAAAACRGTKRSDPIPASLPGSYLYAAKGSTFKKQWQFAARLDLRPDKRYTLTLDKNVDGERESTETTVGSYAVSGDHLLIYDGTDTRTLGRMRGFGGYGSDDIHKLVIKSDSLIAEVGWTAEVFLKGVGAPNIVFVKERQG